MRKIHGNVYREDSEYVAQCLGFDISSRGESQEEAFRRLKEACELFLDEDG